MRRALYNALVNKVPGITYRYHRMHDGTHGWKKVLSWVYLFILNFCYHILFMRFLGQKPGAELYENRRLPLQESESKMNRRQNADCTVEKFVEKLSKYEIISFDLFDTLIFRPFDAPTDLFYFLDEKAGILDFHRIRIEMESEARKEHFERRKNYEVSLQEIWDKIEKEAGPASSPGMEAELQLERQYCYANPFMLEVYQRLKELGARMIITTDMYLPESFLTGLLEENGYSGFEKIFVSNSLEKSKAEGSLYDVVRQHYGNGTRIIHVGDNEHSDVRMAGKHGLDTMYYPNINKYSLTYRAHDMSSIIGSSYRGIVNAHLYSGLHTYSMEYEYGFVYGGLFVLGYCTYIHKYCKKNDIDRLLFLARDGDILKQVYDLLYPGEDTHYVLWGRFPAAKMMADYNRYDYFRRMLLHKTGERKTAGQLLTEAGLSSLTAQLDQEQQTLTASTVITAANVNHLKSWMQENWTAVLDCYQEEARATQQVFQELLAGSLHAAAVDIGWAGSGAASLAYLCERVWKIPCRITGILAGTNTIHNTEPDASEAMLQTGRLTAYLYSQRENRDLLKKHDLNRDYNVYWEMLLSSEAPRFLGYAFDDDGGVIPKFGKTDVNPELAREIQSGILDFVREYRSHFKDQPEMFRISGRDAYAPMLAAAGHKERYLKEMRKRFQLEISVGGSE